MVNPWKEASTLILSALKPSKDKFKWNFEILVLKRSSKSTFMPSGTVFPGGNTHFADESKQWLSIFSEATVNFHKSFNPVSVPPILTRSEYLEIPKLLSLKITAIRETFEETGILLCRNRRDESKESDNSWISHVDLNDSNEWRTAVQEKPTKFIDLCLRHDYVPDVKNLYLWSNWLTPTSAGKKRFDTVFFLSCLGNNVSAVPDKKEIDDSNWMRPDELIALYNNKEIRFLPPQLYEISRLLRFEKVQDLKAFARTRSAEGCQRWMPQIVKALDGSVFLLPGDDAYQMSDVHKSTEPHTINITMREFRDQCYVLHRMEFPGSFAGALIVKNYLPSNGHVLPKLHRESI